MNRRPTSIQSIYLKEVITNASICDQTTKITD